jgi:hypothetical protein
VIIHGAGFRTYVQRILIGSANATAMDTTNYRPNALQFLIGPLFLLCAALVYNGIMRGLGRPSISQGVRWIANQRMGAEIAGGVIGGLVAHWLLNDGESWKK